MILILTEKVVVGYFKYVIMDILVTGAVVMLQLEQVFPVPGYLSMVTLEVKMHVLKCCSLLPT